MMQDNVQNNINTIKNLVGNVEEMVIRNIVIGKKSTIQASIIYINGLVNKDVIDRDILNPLMLHVEETVFTMKNLDDYICKKYIPSSNAYVETDVNKVVDGIKRGKTILVLQGTNNFIVVDTTGGVYRSIQEPPSDISLRGPREGFVENLEINISIMRRLLKDKNLVTENFTLGRRSQTDLVIMYLDDVVDKDYLSKIRDKVNAIDIDSVQANSFIEQCIEEHPYSLFPQVIGYEKPDQVQASILEGRIAFLLSGTSFVTIYPTTFIQFLQTPEDYYGRNIQADLIRILRLLAIFIVTSFPPIYITLVKFNSELIPLEYIKSLVQARQGIALTSFMSLLSMELTIELLREGGLRLPAKIGQTLSVVGGIIIGDAALKAKIVSSPTLLIAGISTVASFAISNYQMSIAIRTIAYPMIILANWLGVLGIVLGWFFTLAYLCSLENFGVPYFSFRKNDMKDTLIRAPLWKMNKRPVTIPHADPIRQSDFRGGKNE